MPKPPITAPITAGEAVIDCHRGENKAEPQERRGDDAVAQSHLTGAEVTEYATEHPGHDDICNKGIDKRQESPRLLAIRRHLFRCFAERLNIKLAETHVVDGAGEPGDHHCDYDSEIIDAREGHDIPPAISDNRARPFSDPARHGSSTASGHALTVRPSCRRASIGYR